MTIMCDVYGDLEWYHFSEYDERLFGEWRALNRSEMSFWDWMERWEKATWLEREFGLWKGKSGSVMDPLPVMFGGVQPLFLNGLMTSMRKLKELEESKVIQGKVIQGYKEGGVEGEASGKKSSVMEGEHGANTENDANTLKNIERSSPPSSAARATGAKTG